VSRAVGVSPATSPQGPVCAAPTSGATILSSPSPFSIGSDDLDRSGPHGGGGYGTTLMRKRLWLHSTFSSKRLKLSRTPASSPRMEANAIDSEVSSVATSPVGTLMCPSEEGAALSFLSVLPVQSRHEMDYQSLSVPELQAELGVEGIGVAADWDKDDFIAVLSELDRICLPLLSAEI